MPVAIDFQRSLKSQLVLGMEGFLMNKVLKYILFIFTLIISGLMSWVGYVFATGVFYYEFRPRDSVLMWASIGTFTITFISFVYHLYKDSRELGNPFFALRVFKYIFFFISIVFLTFVVWARVDEFIRRQEGSELLFLIGSIILSIIILFLLVLSIYKDSRKK